MRDVIIKCEKGEVKKTLAYIEKKDRKVRWASESKPTERGSGFDRYGVYLVIENDVLTFIELEEFEDSDKKGKDVVSAKEFLGKSKSPHIVIFRRGRNVIAKDVATGNKGIAKCSPDDEFVFKTGASIALARLMAKTPMVLTDDVKAEWKKALGIEDIPARVDHKFKVGDHVTLKEGFVAGKVYGGLTLLGGAMYDNAYNKRMTVVRVDWSDDSNTYYYECKGDSRFTFHYSEEMLDKWDKSKIHEGDKVRIKECCTGMRYDTYYSWVKKHISDPDLLLAFERDRQVSTDFDYEVVKIAPHGVHPTTLAYIKYKGTFSTICYLFDVEALEKV